MPLPFGCPYGMASLLLAPSPDSGVADGGLRRAPSLADYDVLVVAADGVAVVGPGVYIHRVSLVGGGLAGLVHLRARLVGLKARLIALRA